MKRSAFTILLSLALSLSPALAHKPKKGMVEAEALKKLLPQGVTVDAQKLEWDTVAQAELPKVQRLKALAHAEVPAAAAQAEIHLARFTVEGDWGPIQAVAAVQDEKLLGLEILAFTDHVGDAVTQPMFLSQFQGLPLKGVHSAPLKPLPKEPLTVEALRAGLIGFGQLVQEPGNEEQEHEEHKHQHTP